MNIQFFGATGEVTGSCYLVTCGDQRVLVDCGLIQGSRSHEKHNRDDFPFDPASIDAVVLTHAHLDHSGRLPVLVKRGFAGRIHTHPATIDLCEIMLADAGYLNEREAHWENKRRNRKTQDPVKPLFTRKEALDSIERFDGHEYDDPFQVCSGITCTLRDAGHILGSAIVELSLVEMSLTENSLCRKLVFSGDLGNPGAPILRDPHPVSSADLVVMESTYGDRLHRPWSSTWEEMGEVIAHANSAHGNILIPAFTIGRTQLLLYTFREFFDEWRLDNWSIVLDTPMGIAATEVYERYPRLYDASAKRIYTTDGNPFDLPNFYASKTTEDSMKLNEIDSGVIVIAGSGMCTGGRIKHHLKHNISGEQNKIMMVGFQARGTTGRQLVDGADQIRLWDKDYAVNAEVHTIGGLSAHADQNDLCDWFGAIDGSPVCALVHGEPLAAEALESRLIEQGVRQVIRPKYQQKIDLAD
jgi:metallo-beta-lactamase family protein